ncbi:hypothetical protein [Streptomyces sp. NPDC003077]|uniref:hypothetical protein n=1 Tax=Streptomyces sp. NPDC003077 TaxID=3154443 RepID=UPI0033A32161
MQTSPRRHAADRGATAATAPNRPRSMTTAAGLVATAAFVYGAYMIFVDRTSGDSLGRAGILGLISFVVSLALGLLVIGVQRFLINEQRALLYGAVFGVTTGFMYSVTGPSILRCMAVGAMLGAAMFVVSLYLFRNLRVPEPHTRRWTRRANQRTPVVRGRGHMPAAF